MSGLAQYVGKAVVVITSDGRLFTGILQGYDQTTNIILESAKERVITPDAPTEVLDLGLYLLRGESVALCGLVDDEIDSQIDWDKVRGLRLGETKKLGL
ncbi:uncharacterized protein V1513DRAFT_447827 [Lipomyces chichibuensis]|uniref:uncharacterized protein n=1 Tax=Lipomyces chichibuensis TaxID=1546026 RepID=UPI003342F3B5